MKTRKISRTITVVLLIILLIGTMAVPATARGNNARALMSVNTYSALNATEVAAVLYKNDTMTVDNFGWIGSNRYFRGNITYIARDPNFPTNWWVWAPEVAFVYF